MQYATTGASDQHLQKRYLLVTRENKYIVLQYYIGVQYTNEWMNEHLPSPDITGIPRRRNYTFLTVTGHGNCERVK